MVKMERIRAEAVLEREMEERRKKKEHAKRIKRILEAAFDGDNDEIRAVLREVTIKVLMLTIALTITGK